VIPWTSRPRAWWDQLPRAHRGRYRGPWPHAADARCDPRRLGAPPLVNHRSV